MTTDPLRAVSNVIELKPDRKYLLIFQGNFDRQAITELMRMLHMQGVNGIGIALRTDEGVEVIEMPAQEQEAFQQAFAEGELEP
jgi:hypothetical protein